MNFYTIDQIKDHASDGSYKFVSVENHDGKDVVAQNRPGEGRFEEKLEEIETRLNSKALPDGVYYVCFKANQYKNSVTDKLAFLKGNPQNVPLSQSPLPAKPRPEESVRSYEAAIDDKVKVTELTMRIESLERENAQLLKDKEVLQEEIDRLEEELEEFEETLQEGEQENLTTHFTNIIVPFAEEFFNLRKSELALKYAELERNGQKVPAANSPQPQKPQRQTVKSPQITFQNFQQFLIAAEDNEEEFERRLLYIQKTNPGLYPAAVQWVQDNYELEEEEEDDSQEETTEEDLNE